MTLLVVMKTGHCLAGALLGTELELHGSRPAKALLTEAHCLIPESVKGYPRKDFSKAWPYR